MRFGLGYIQRLTITAPSYPYVNPEAANLVAHMDVEPSDGMKALIDACWSRIKTSNHHIVLDCFHIFNLHTEQASLLNWIHPDDGTMVGFGGFTPFLGFSGNLISSVQNKAPGDLFLSQNNASVGLYRSGAGFGSNSAMLNGNGCYLGGTTGLVSKQGSLCAPAGDAVTTAMANAGGNITEGMHGLRRTSSNSIQFVGVNGATLATSSTSVAQPSVNKVLGNLVILGGTANKGFWMGASKNDTGFALFTQAIRDFQAGLGGV